MLQCGRRWQSSMSMPTLLFPRVPLVTQACALKVVVERISRSTPLTWLSLSSVACPGRREMVASYRRFARSRLFSASFLCPFSPGTSGLICILQVLQSLACATPPSRRTNRGPNQPLLIILGSCDEGFDLKRKVVQTLRGQTVETGIHLEIVNIFCHFLM